jgi:hypothetical protein
LLGNGVLVNASGVDPNGSASGSTLTVTVSGNPFGTTADGPADGTTITVTSSVSTSGTATEVVFADGDTITVDTSVSLEGTVSTVAIDGGKIFEFNTFVAEPLVYTSIDYDSIYSRGDRYASGLIETGQYGWNTVFSPMSDGFDETYGSNGPAASGTTNGAAFWFRTVDGEGIDLRGFTLIGSEEIDSLENFWGLYGAYTPGVRALTPYFREIQYFNPNQLTETTGYADDWFYTEYQDEPVLYIPYSLYEFVYVSGPRPDVRWANEIWLKVAHSNLDGGNRIPGVAAPSKTVTVGYSSDWGFRVATGHDTLQNAAFDGKFIFDTTKKQVGIGQAANSNNAVSTVGAWFSFQFPRPVTPKHLCFVLYNHGEEEYTGGDPDAPAHYGMWHWEFSENGGGSWESVGDPWVFRDNCSYMIAPRTPNFDLGDVGEDGLGATHWRMVLDQGPAFGGGRDLMQIIFDLDDPTDLAPPFYVNFTDDTDGIPVVPVIGDAGSPYIVTFTDGSSDVLDYTVLNIPNPVLTIAYTDNGTFEHWSDLYPSMVVQTIVIAKGRQ